MSEESMVPKTFRTSKENLDYLKRVGKINHRSVSQLIHLGISYVIENHRRVGTGNQVNLDLLRILGSSEAPTEFSTDRQLLRNTTTEAKETTR
jgi:hypothetical protein